MSDAKRATLTKDQLEHLQKRLLEERKLVLRELGRFTETFDESSTAADGDLTNYPFHLADQGTDTMETEKSFLLASAEGRLLWSIDEALRRLYREPERFGRCERCDDLMDFARLDALPHARLCIECKAREEQRPRPAPSSDEARP